MKKEIKIKGSVDAINIPSTKKILNQMINCICKIKINEANGTGFFCKVSLSENNDINFLMTNYHVIDEKYLKENKEINILLNDDNEAKKIDLNIKRMIYYNEEYDTTIIELKEEDNIKEHLELDDNILKDNENIFYEKKSIYILHYPNGEDACVSYGILNKINKYDIIHVCSTDCGSSGSPILNLKNNKVIGIHKGSPDYTKNFNYGTLLKYPLNDFISQHKTKDTIIDPTPIDKCNINVNNINNEEKLKDEEENSFIKSNNKLKNTNIKAIDNKNPKVNNKNSENNIPHKINVQYFKSLKKEKPNINSLKEDNAHDNNIGKYLNPLLQKQKSKEINYFLLFNNIFFKNKEQTIINTEKISEYYKELLKKEYFRHKEEKNNKVSLYAFYKE